METNVSDQNAHGIQQNSSPRNQMIKFKHPSDLLKTHTTDEYWVQLDGTKIKVSEMTENHVRNALRRVIRNARENQETLRWIDKL